MGGRVVPTPVASSVGGWDGGRMGATTREHVVEAVERAADHGGVVEGVECGCRQCWDRWGREWWEKRH